MVTVKKFMVTSVTVTESRLEKLGVQDEAGRVDKSWMDSFCLDFAVGSSRDRQQSFIWWLRCFAECLPGWGTDIPAKQVVLWPPWSPLCTSGRNAQVYVRPAPPKCLCSLLDLGVIVVFSWNLLVSWMRLGSDVSPRWCKRRAILDRLCDTGSSSNLLRLVSGSAELHASSSS